MTTLSFIEELTLLYKRNDIKTLLIEKLTDAQQKHLTDHNFDVEWIVTKDCTEYYEVDLSSGSWDEDSPTVIRDKINEYGKRIRAAHDAKEDARSQAESEYADYRILDLQEKIEELEDQARSPGPC